MTDATTLVSETDLQNYEIMLLLSSEIGEEGAKKELNDLRSLISSSGGKLKNEDFIGLKELAYTVKKQDHGFYIVLNLELPTEKTSEFEKLFNINNAILRYLFLKVSANHQIKSLTEFNLEAEKAEKVEKVEKARPAKEPEEAPKEKIITKKAEATEVKQAPEVEQKSEEIIEEEAKVEPAPKKKVKKASEDKSKLDELDEKLKSIINNPDISL